MRYREHPLKIIKYGKKYLWLLILPLIRMVVTYSRFDFSREAIQKWLSGSAFDIVILVLICVFGFFEWYNSTFEFDEYGITHYFGIFIKGSSNIKAEKIVSIVAERNFYIRPFHAVRLYIDTCAGNLKDSDMTLLVSYGNYGKMKAVLPIFKRTKASPRENKPKIWQIILFSTLFSSSFTGTIYVIMFFIQGGRSALNAIEQFRIQQHINEFSENVSRRVHFIPSAAITIALIFALMWFISFVGNVIKYLDFKVYNRGKNIKINYGIFTKRDYYFDTSRINYTDLRQNLLMKNPWWNIMSVMAVTSGYGQKNTQIPVFIPIIGAKEMDKTLRLLMPYYEIVKNLNKPQPILFWSFIWKPTLLGLFVLAAGITLSIIFSFMSSVIIFLLIMFEIPIVWAIIVKFISIWTTGVGIDRDRVTIKYCSGVKFHTVLCNAKKIVHIETRQTWFQKQSGVCNLYIQIEQRTSKWHKVIGISMKDAKRIERALEKLDFENSNNTKKVS